jgi:hypothetical protein
VPNRGNVEVFAGWCNGKLASRAYAFSAGVNTGPTIFRVTYNDERVCDSHVYDSETIKSEFEK